MSLLYVVLMERRVSAGVAAVASALASGGLAVAICYRLWGARSNDTADRVGALEAKFGDLYKAVSATNARVEKVDDMVIRVADTVDAAVAKEEAARAARAALPKWECTALSASFDHDYTDGVCGPSSAECSRLRIETLRGGKLTGECVKQAKVFCYEVDGVASCRPTPVSCEANRKHAKDVDHMKVGDCEAR